MELCTLLLSGIFQVEVNRCEVYNGRVDNCRLFLNFRRTILKYEVSELKGLNIEIRNGEAIVTLNGKQIVLTEGERLDVALTEEAEPAETEVVNEEPEKTEPEKPKRGAGYAEYAAMYANEKPAAEQSTRTTAKAPKVKSDPKEDFIAAMKISLTNFRGSKIIFKSLKNIWYDRELQTAIKNVNGIVAYFILIIGAALIMLFGSKHFDTTVTAALTIGFILIDIFIINPFMLYIAAPKPIRAHIKEIDKMDEKDREVYEAEINTLKVSRSVQRLVDRHDESGNMIYRDRN